MGKVKNNVSEIRGMVRIISLKLGKTGKDKNHLNEIGEKVRIISMVGGKGKNHLDEMGKRLKSSRWNGGKITTESSVQDWRECENRILWKIRIEIVGR